MYYEMKKDIKIIKLDDEEKRKMQMIILEILIEFDRICRKHNIPYAIDGGTMLGAVRHKGFIPWDLDADIVIMRKDYERFKDICATELDCKFFLQDYNTDEFYRWGYARLLRNETEYVRAGHEHMKSKNGVFVDIFTMDSVPDNNLLKVFHRAQCFCIRKILWSEVGRVVHKNFFARKWFWLLSRIPKKTMFTYRNRIATKCNRNENSILIRHMCSPHPKALPYGFPRSYFDELIEYEFEGHYFYGFKDYDSYLRSIYGDYMILPPEDKRDNQIPCSKIKLL